MERFQFREHPTIFFWDARASEISQKKKLIVNDVMASSSAAPQTQHDVQNVLEVNERLLLEWQKLQKEPRKYWVKT